MTGFTVAAATAAAETGGVGATALAGADAGLATDTAAGAEAAATGISFTLPLAIWGVAWVTPANLIPTCCISAENYSTLKPSATNSPNCTEPTTIARHD